MMRLVTLALSCLVLLACSDDHAVHSSDGIERVEPPFWWQGFNSHEAAAAGLRQRHLSELTPSLDYPGYRR